MRGQYMLQSVAIYSSDFFWPVTLRWPLHFVPSREIFGTKSERGLSARAAP